MCPRVTPENGGVDGGRHLGAAGHQGFCPVDGGRSMSKHDGGEGVDAFGASGLGAFEEAIRLNVGRGHVEREGATKLRNG